MEGGMGYKIGKKEGWGGGKKLKIDNCLSNKIIKQMKFENLDQDEILNWIEHIWIGVNLITHMNHMTCGQRS